MQGQRKSDLSKNRERNARTQSHYENTALEYDSQNGSVKGSISKKGMNSKKE